MNTETKKEISLTEWFNGTQDLLNLGFTEKEIHNAILESGNSIESLTEIKGFQQLPTYLKRAEIVKEKGYSYYVEEYDPRGGDYHKTVNKIGLGVRIPAQYQSLRHGEILYTLFSNKWNWFSSFTKKTECSNKKYLSDLPISEIPKEYQHLTPTQLRREYIIEKELKECSQWTIYEIRNDGEIYLETEFGSLYVPIKALTESDYSKIENRMKSYAKSYHDPINLSGYALNHRGRTKEQYKKDKINDYNNMIKPLESKEALKLKLLLS